MLRVFVTGLVILLTLNVNAKRNLILSPSKVIYELESQQTLTLIAQDDVLTLVQLVTSEKVESVPEAEVRMISQPVLSAVQFGGGSIGSVNIDDLKYLTIGYGAHYCELSNCPNKVTFVFKNGNYIETLRHVR